MRLASLGYHAAGRIGAGHEHVDVGASIHPAPSSLCRGRCRRRSSSRHLDQDQLIPLMNERCRTLQVAAPVSKALACGDVGVGAMAEVGEIASAVDSILKMYTSSSKE